MQHAQSLALLIRSQDQALRFYELRTRQLQTLVGDQAELIEWLSDRHEGFYQSPQWLELRTRVLESYGTACMACGTTPADGSVIHVDHIKPKSRFPQLALDFDNLQVLCQDCNFGKSNRGARDWRPVETQKAPTSVTDLEDASLPEGIEKPPIISPLMARIGSALEQLKYPPRHLSPPSA